MRQIFLPKNDKLKNFIRYFLFYSSANDKRQFLVFPNPGSAIGLHKEHDFVRKEKNVFEGIATTGNNQLLHINRIDPVEVIDEGLRESITIVFCPFGVNYFIRNDLEELVLNNESVPSYIKLDEYGFKGLADEVFELKSEEAQLEFLENYFLKKWKDPGIPYIEQSLEFIMDMELERTIPEICKTIGTSSRNLSRLFNRHIGLSPVQLRNICQFRYSLNKKFEEGEKSLKDVGYESNYGDASYMFRMYKKYTGHNPSLFFNKAIKESNYVFLPL